MTIYKEDRANLCVSMGDIIIFKLGEIELIRPVRADFHISLPKKLLKKKSRGQKIKLNILRVVKRIQSLKRPDETAEGDDIDIRHFIPLKTMFGYPIYVIERTKECSTVWYAIGGGVNHINIKNIVKTSKIAELLGFYFGDGNTSPGIRSFRLNNSEPSTLNSCLAVLEDMGISRKMFKGQIIYSTNKNEITLDVKKRCVAFWSAVLEMDKTCFNLVVKKSIS
ncbi:MAG: hypothetical protein ABIA62_04755 [Candidatus Woesearchaeota archaeon]